MIKKAQAIRLFQRAFDLSEPAATSAVEDPYLLAKLSACAFAESDQRVDIWIKPVFRGLPVDKSDWTLSGHIFSASGDFVDNGSDIRRIPELLQPAAPKTRASLFQVEAGYTPTFLTVAGMVYGFNVQHDPKLLLKRGCLSLKQAENLLKGYHRSIEESQSLHNKSGSSAANAFRRAVGFDKTGATVVCCVRVNVGIGKTVRTKVKLVKAHITASESTMLTFHELDEDSFWGEGTLFLFSDLKP